jgi:hypothetical protein
MTLQEWVYLVWNTEALYNGHPGGEDVRGILDRTDARYGFTVEDALDGYEAARRQTSSDFFPPTETGSDPGAQPSAG